MSIMRNPKASRQALQAYNQHSSVVGDENSQKSQEDVFIAYRPKIVAIARRLYGRLSSSSSLEVDDLVSAGGMGLLEKLWNVMMPRGTIDLLRLPNIESRGAMIDLMRSYDHVSRYRRDQAKELQQASTAFFQKQVGKQLQKI